MGVSLCTGCVRGGWDKWGFPCVHAVHWDGIRQLAFQIAELISILILLKTSV